MSAKQDVWCRAGKPSAAVFGLDFTSPNTNSSGFDCGLYRSRSILNAFAFSAVSNVSLLYSRRKPMTSSAKIAVAISPKCEDLNESDVGKRSNVSFIDEAK